MTDSTKTVGSLRRRMLDDMTLRRLNPKTQAGYLRAVIVKVTVASVNKLRRLFPSYCELRFDQFYWDSDKPPAPVASFSFVDSNVRDFVPWLPGKAPVVLPGSPCPARHDVVLG